MAGVKEVDAEARCARYLRVTPEEIVLTRNTSEANNLVSSGLDLQRRRRGAALRRQPSEQSHARGSEKAKRFGYSVTTVPQVNPHPGPDYYVDAFARAITPRTKVLALTHLTNTAGDPAASARAVPPRARARGAHAGGRCPELRAARRGPVGHAARLLQRQRAQVAVRPQRGRRPVHQRSLAGAALAQHLQRQSGARWAPRVRSRVSASATSRRCIACGVAIEFVTRDWPARRSRPTVASWDGRSSRACRRSTACGSGRARIPSRSVSVISFQPGIACAGAGPRPPRHGWHRRRGAWRRRSPGHSLLARTSTTAMPTWRRHSPRSKAIPEMTNDTMTSDESL